MTLIYPLLAGATAGMTLALSGAEPFYVVIVTVVVAVGFRFTMENA